MQGQTFGKVQTVLETQTQELVPKKQVGILGGNFNPVHYAHLVMGEQVGQALGLDKVYFMPEYFPFAFITNYFFSIFIAYITLFFCWINSF